MNKGFFLDTHGFSANRNDCFVHSVIVAMMCYVRSPFTQIPPLRDAFCGLITDRPKSIKALRTYGTFGDYDQHDASEFFMKLAETFFPDGLLDLRETRTFYNSMTGYRVVERETISQNAILPQEWTYTTQFDPDNFVRKKSRTYDTLTVEKDILRVKNNCIVVFMKRQNFATGTLSRDPLDVYATIEANDRTGRPTTYHLCAAVCHHGYDYNSGHYTTIVFDGDTFYRYDDTDVSRPIRDNVVHPDEAFTSLSRHALIVFYYGR